MTCDKFQRLLDAHVDGELDLVTNMDVEEHLRQCAACAKAVSLLQARQRVLRASLPRFTAPASLRERITIELRGESNATAGQRNWSPSSPSWWAAIAAAAAIALVAGYAWGGAEGRSDRLLHEALSDHVRSLSTGRLIDVASSDQHTVKPWFTGKLDFSPPVVNLAPAGFPLEGGRLEYLDGRPAAALVFKHGPHPINLFIWPKHGEEHVSGKLMRTGYSAEAWTVGDLNFLAVSEITATELAQFITAYRNVTR